MTKGKKLTTIADLLINDVFITDLDSTEYWRIISVNSFFPSMHMYGALAARIQGGKFKTKAFRKNMQVVYIKKLIMV